MSARDTPLLEIDAPPDALVHLAATRADEFPVLFDSAARGSLGAYTILPARPVASLWSDREGRVHASGRSIGAETKARGLDFFTALDAWWASDRIAGLEMRAPFCGGWIVLLGYEAVQDIEPALSLPPASLPWRALALRSRGALIHDHERRRTYATAEPGAEGLVAELGAAAIDAAHRLAVRNPCNTAPLAVRGIREEPPEAFLSRARAAREHIAAGDVYQANLSRPWHVTLEAAVSPGDIYHRLRKTNPAPFAALLQWDGVAMLSSSPERLVRVAGGKVHTRPIAGTRPRSWSPGGDTVEASALIAHPKERAEHVMLVDLERNDLGKVCRPGTVRVDELMTIESYAHVHHIVSSVTGELRPDVTPAGVLRAVFPGGTITGCPKFRCMEIIAALEGEGRGAYTGSVGYLSHDGSLDFNILIRTMVQQGERLEFRAGAGIVADSDPERELDETRAKARGMVRALGSDIPGSRPAADPIP